MQKIPFTLRAQNLSAATLIATLATVASLSVSSSALAQSAAPAGSVTLYGRLDLGLEFNNDGSQDRTAVQNFASRIGFKGERSFGDGLSGVFQVETGVAPDDTSQSKTFASRNSFVGLKSGTLGALIVGTHDMPLKSLEGTANQLWGEGEAMEVIIHGKGTSTSVGSSTFANVHTRKTNVLLYTSPKFSNIVAKLAYSPDEAQTAAANKVMVGGSIEYNDGMFNIGLAAQSQDKFNAAPAVAAKAATPTSLAVNAVPGVDGTTMAATKITAGVKFAQASFGVAYSNLDNNAGKKTDNWLVTGSYTMGPWVLKANYGQSSESASGASDDVQMAALEADYALDKQFTVYGYYAAITNGSKAKGTFAGADNFPATAVAGTNPNAVGFGVRFNF